MFSNSLEKLRFVLPTLIAVILFILPISLSQNTTLGSFSYHLNLATAQTPTVPTPITTEQQEGDSGSAGLAKTSDELFENEANRFLFNMTSFLGWAIAWLGGNLLNVGIGVFTVNMTSIANALHLSDSINALWVIVRDLFNLLFIFGLILAGFKMILGIDESGTKRMISSIIIAALVINFSLYVVQLAVDFTSVLSYQITNLISVNKTGEVFGIEYPLLAEGFTTVSGVESTTEGAGLNNVKSSGLFAGDIDNPFSAFVLGLLFMCFYTLLGFTFAAGAFLLFTRFLVLLILMVTSPLMFIGRVFPFFKQIGDMWIKNFVGQLLVGPVYLFMLLIASVTMQQMPTNSSGFLGLIFYMLIVSGLLFTSFVVAKKMGGIGAGQSVNMMKGMGKWARARVQNATVGAFGRNTIGRIGDGWNRSLEERGVSEKSFRRSIASSLGGGKYGGSYSRADARAAEEKAGVKKARYQAIYGDKKSGRGGIVGAIQAGHGSNDPDKLAAMERAIAGATNEQIAEILSKHKPGSKEYEAAVQHMTASQFDHVYNKTKPEELDDNAKAEIAKKYHDNVKAAVGTKIATANAEQLRILGATEIAARAADLKQSQFEKIMDDKQYTPTEKKQISDARKEQQKDRFKNNPASVFFEADGKRKKGKDVAKLPVEEILNTDEAVPHLVTDDLRSMTDEQIDPTIRMQIATKIIANKDAKPDTVDFLKNNPKGREFANINTGTSTSKTANQEEADRVFKNFE